MDQNSFKIAPNEIISKSRKKKRSWFRIFFNLLIFFIIFVVILLSLRSLYAYYSIYKHIPVDDVDSYIIVDNRYLDLNANWQSIFSKVAIDSLNINQEDWQKLRLDTKYYWGAYISDYDNFKINYLFYLPTFDPILKERLTSLNIPFVYNGNILLLNDSRFIDFNASKFFNVDIINRLCAGKLDNRNFDCSKAENIEISISNQKRITKQRNFLDFNDYRDSLSFASNKLYWSTVKSYVSDDFMANLDINDNVKVELVVFNDKNTLFGRDFVLVLKNMTFSDDILEKIKYYIAYNNLQERETILKDKTLVVDYYLDFQNFTYLDNNSYKKIPLGYETGNFLYLAEVNQNLVFTTKASVIDKLLEENQMTNKSFPESVFSTDSLKVFPYIDSVMNICKDWTIVDENKMIIKACE